MIDVVFYDLDRAFCPPDLRAPVGGSEVELYQLVKGMKAAGLDARLVLGKPRADFGPVRRFVFWRQVEKVEWCAPVRAYVRATDHLIGDQGHGLTTVCVSQWQASHITSPTVVIPPPLGEHVARNGIPTNPDRWIYASAANKGIRETLEAWSLKPRGAELVITSTGYDEPEPGLVEAYADAGAKWLGKLSPIEMVEAMAGCRGMYYRNAAPETFGVTTAIAVKLGLVLDVQCVGHSACGLAESREPQDLSMKATIARWLEVLAP